MSIPAVQIMSDDEMKRSETSSEEPGFGALQTQAGNLPLKGLDVKVRVSGLTFEATVRQTYVNKHEEPLEATYIFPLPDRGAVRDFKMAIDDRVIEGVLKERGQARREYQAAIDSGHRASIVEEERPDVFTMRVGNIAPGEEATIEFTVVGPLVFADGEATFRFPLVVAPRYIPGAPLDGPDVGSGVASDTDAVPDASRITPPTLLPGFPNPVDLGITVDIETGSLPVRNVRSSLHAVTSSSTDKRQRLEIRPGERVNRDFILRFDVADESIGTSFCIVPDEDGSAGTFALTVVPPSRASEKQKPRDVVFVLDRSGSMGGWKMVAARRAVGRMLDTLTPHDRFQVLIFDDSVETPQNLGDTGLVEATNRNRYRAIEHLSKVEARGGTEMAQPLFQALDLVSGGYSDRHKSVILVTDGQVGNEGQILKGAGKRMKNVHMFTVGIDRAVNAGFLDRLAGLGGGRSELVESEDRLDEAMDRIHRLIGTPVLTELTMHLDGATLDASSIAPSRLPDLFAGTPVMIWGRYKGSKTPTMRVSAAKADGGKWSHEVPAELSSDRATPSLWARAHIRDLEDRYETSRRSVSSDTIAAVSLEFGVLCRFTSWVAIDREAKVEPHGDLRQVTQPVEQPDGWQGAPMQSRSYAMPAPAPMVAPPGASFGARGGGGAWSSIGGLPPEPSVLSEAAEGFSPWDEEAAPAAPRARKMKKEAARHTSAAMSPAPKGHGGGVAPPAYRAPEEVRGEARTERGDVFVLGAICYELLTGTQLFPGSEVKASQSIMTFDPADLGHRAGIPAEWLAILQRALDPTAQYRYANAREMLEHMRSRLGDDLFDLPTGKGGGLKHTASGPTLEAVLQTTQIEPEVARVAASWLVAAVAREHDRTGMAVALLSPATIVVRPDWKLQLPGDAHDSGVFQRLKRWLGLEKGEPRDEFWK